MNFPLLDSTDISQNIYPCSPYTKSSGFSQLMYYVMQTRDYPVILLEIKKLIESDPLILNKINTKGWTALMLSCRNSGTCSTEDTVQLLIDAKADLNIKHNNGWITVRDSHGTWGPL